LILEYATRPNIKSADPWNNAHEYKLLRTPRHFALCTQAVYLFVEQGTDSSDRGFFSIMEDVMTNFGKLTLQRDQKKRSIEDCKGSLPIGKPCAR
jgi:hypothetical protein